MIRILIAEDDKDLNQTVCRHLNAGAIIWASTTSLWNINAHW
ncbi:hypothetical protein [Lachnoclostridium sp. An196]|nr:hypothetical protein [Lachnoclostridium sp. An196]